MPTFETRKRWPEVTGQPATVALGSGAGLLRYARNDGVGLVGNFCLEAADGDTPVHDPRRKSVPADAGAEPRRGPPDPRLSRSWPARAGEATVYLPTQRAARAFGRALAEASGATSLALPRIVPLGAFAAEEGEAAEFEAGARRCPRRRRSRPAHDARPAGRRLGPALKGAIRRCGADGELKSTRAEPPLVAATAAAGAAASPATSPR